MSSRTPAPAELAEQLLRALEDLRQRGDAAYPLTLKSLAESTCPSASSAQIEKAVGTRFFQSRVVLTRRKQLEAPLAFVENVGMLANSAAVLEFLLRQANTPSNQAHSVSDLKKKATSRLQKPLQAALSGQIEEGTLPEQVGWLTINRSKKLFLLGDVHRGQSSTRPESQTSQAPLLAANDSDFGSRFDAMFDQADRRSGAHNFVSLLELRNALPVSRSTFDAELKKLRLEGRYGLSAAEGRHGLRSEEQEAGILEDGVLLLYVSRKAGN